MWGLCLSATNCGEEDDERSREPGAEAESVLTPTVNHVGQSISVQESEPAQGCAGGGGSSPLAPLFFGVALLWRRRRTLLLPLLCVVPPRPRGRTLMMVGRRI